MKKNLERRSSIKGKVNDLVKYKENASVKEKDKDSRKINTISDKEKESKWDLSDKPKKTSDKEKVNEWDLSDRPKKNADKEKESKWDLSDRPKKNADKEKESKWDLNDKPKKNSDKEKESKWDLSDKPKKNSYKEKESEWDLNDRPKKTSEKNGNDTKIKIEINPTQIEQIEKKNEENWNSDIHEKGKFEIEEPKTLEPHKTAKPHTQIDTNIKIELPETTPTKEPIKNSTHEINPEKIKEKIRNLDWKDYNGNWDIKPYHREPVRLDPTADCSLENPLYMNKDWLNKVYDELNLSDRQIGKMYELEHKTIGYWREKHGIETRKPAGKSVVNGYVVLFMPKDYRHPQMIPDKSDVIRRKQHVIVMENYLREHPNLDISKECLVDGKYLKIECEVHHINHIRTDTRLENLHLFKTKSEHSQAQRSLNDAFGALVKLEQIIFTEGKYYLNEIFEYRNMAPNEIQERIKPAQVKTFENIEDVKIEMKKIDWSKISNNWTITERYGNMHSKEDLDVLIHFHKIFKNICETILNAVSNEK
jgi:hypothetical protein